MIRHICTILRNEWRRSLSLWLELVIVASLLWFVIDKLFITYEIYRQPMGFDIEHTYCLRLGYLEPRSPLYQSDLSKEENRAQLISIRDRIAACPMLEAVSTSLHARPHTWSNRSSGLGLDSTRHIGLERMVSPEFFRVFRYTNLEGETEPLVEASLRGEIILGEDYAEQFWGKGNAKEGIGKQLISDNGDPNKPVKYQVGEISQTIRYDQFINWTNYFATPMTDAVLCWFADNKEFWGLEICMRVKPEEDKDFIRRFREQMTEQITIGNFYIGDLFSIKENRDTNQQEDFNEIKTQSIVILFLLINIFLGVVGVFWFRTEARRSEIGLRLSLGDTPQGILRKYYLEGLLLLAFAMLPTMAIFYALGYWEVIPLSFMSLTPARYAFGLIATYGLMSLFIVGAIWVPAHRAIRITPSEALRSE